MKEKSDQLWAGLRSDARAKLGKRNYAERALSARVAEDGVEAGKLTTEAARTELRDVWIPGVEIFSRTIYPQRHRGYFGELARREEGVLGKIGLWPKQWSASRMFAGTAKGFHVHPPSIPQAEKAEQWHRRVYAEPNSYSARRYDEEQWDVMFVVQGTVEFILRDLREGLPVLTMRFIVEGDDLRGPNNVGIVIPAGVAHALRAEGSMDAIIIYGTSTVFQPDFEGRIASDVEEAPLPESWQRFLQ